MRATKRRLEVNQRKRERKESLAQYRGVPGARQAKLAMLKDERERRRNRGKA